MVKMVIIIIIIIIVIIVIIIIIIIIIDCLCLCFREIKGAMPTDRIALSRKKRALMNLTPEMTSR